LIEKLFESEKKYHELAQEETNEPDKDKQEANVFPLAGDTFACREARDGRDDGTRDHVGVYVGKHVACYLFHFMTSEAVFLSHGTLFLDQPPL
jgi:hypothetical protein